MKKIFLLISIALFTLTLNAQDLPSGGKEKIKMLDNLHNGLSRMLTFDQMIPPYGIEVTYQKTTHLIFPSAVKYVDLGSNDIIAGKADGTENVIRIKSAVEGFTDETNCAVVCEDGSFYSFNVRYSNEPVKLNIEMKDFLHSYTEDSKIPNNRLEVYLQELGNESPLLVNLIMKSIYHKDKRYVKHIGCNRFGIQALVKGIFTYNDMMYYHTEISNNSNISFYIDFIRFKVVDKKLSKRTAMQETIVYPVRAYNYVTVVNGNKSVRTVWAMQKFTIPDDKVLQIEIVEKDGGRNQLFVLDNSDINAAKIVDELKVK